MDMPTVIRVNEMDAQTRISLDLDIESGLDVFDGHFPGIPVVPGVVQIYWALQLVNRYLRPLSPQAISHIEGLKFHHVITPPAEVRLDLEFSAAALLFTYSSAAGRHASGKIALVP